MGDSPVHGKRTVQNDLRLGLVTGKMICDLTWYVREVNDLLGGVLMIPLTIYVHEKALLWLHI